MRKPVFTRQFERDLRRMRRRGKSLQHLKELMSRLIAGRLLDERHRDHVLIGNYRGRRECHIEPDWLLIYKLEKDKIIFERTGTHTDLFD
jgi:mRNA interferase YafQ